MRKSFFITAFLIGAALGSLLLLAFNQFQLYSRHEQVISQTEKLIFQYAMIREQIIEDIVEGRLHELAQVSSSVEELHTDIIRILDNNLIPPEYRFSFMQQIDLPGLVLLLRRTSNEQEDNNNLLRLIIEETRIIGERFMLLERLILGYAKQKLVDFQLIIIGTLALVVFLVTALMFVTYRLLIVPVLNLTAQSEDVLLEKQDRILDPLGWKEVSLLTGKMNRMLDAMKGCKKSVKRFESILYCRQYVSEKIHEAQNKDDLYQGVCRALLCNPDYILSWIGIADDGGEGVVPVAADGSSTMTGEECQECFGALLAAQEGDDDPACRALSFNETVTRKDVLAAAPQGPFKNTPMASCKVASLSIPVALNGKIYGVLMVYTIVAKGVLEQETAMLQEVAALLAAKMYSFTVRERLEREQIVKKLVSEKNEIIVFDLNRTGGVRNVDTYRQTHDSMDISAKWAGCQIIDIVLPVSDQEKVVLKSSIDEAKRYEFTAELKGFNGTFRAILAPVNEFPADDVVFLLVLIAPQKNVLIQPENFQIAYSAAIGQFARTIAHEITDLSNGIINYAQMVSDESANESGLETKKFLKRIIDDGEKVAGVVSPLLDEQAIAGYSDDLDDIQTIFADVLKLTGHLLRRDGISVEVEIQPPSLQFKKHQLQLILLTLLNELQRIGNKYSLQKDQKKALLFTVTRGDVELQKMIRVGVELPWSEADYGQKNVQADQLSQLWLSRELVKNLGGEMNFSCTDKERMFIEFYLPC